MHVPITTDQYESLRKAVLGDPLLPEARNGLNLFLRRGMWGWAKSLSTMSLLREAMPTSWTGTMPPCDRVAVIHLLAAMAMNTNEGRA